MSQNQTGEVCWIFVVAKKVNIRGKSLRIDRLDFARKIFPISFAICIIPFLVYFDPHISYFDLQSFVPLEQSLIGRCGLPWAKTAAESKWPLRTTRALLFSTRGPQRPIGLCSRWTKLKKHNSYFFSNTTVFSFPYVYWKVV